MPWVLHLATCLPFGIFSLVRITRAFPPPPFLQARKSHFLPPFYTFSFASSGFLQGLPLPGHVGRGNIHEQPWVKRGSTIPNTREAVQYQTNKQTNKQPQFFRIKGIDSMPYQLRTRRSLLALLRLPTNLLVRLLLQKQSDRHRILQHLQLTENHPHALYYSHTLGT